MTENNPSPPSNLNVLIIDTHVLLRQIVAKILRHLKGISKIHSVPSIEEDYIMTDISRLQPDVIFLGMDSPDSKEMNILKIIREEYPMIPIILMTPLSTIGAKAALKGLKMGAVEFITKPDKNAGIMLATRHFKKRIVPVMNVIQQLNLNLLLANYSEEQSFKGVSNVSDKIFQKTSRLIDLVVIAGCTGGVRALFKLVSSLSFELPVPVIIVQHMPKIYSRELAEELDTITSLNVREAQNDSPLIAGQIYIAPGGYHTIVKNDGIRKKLYIHRGPRVQKNRPSIDVLLRSAVQVYDKKLLSVILSGAGMDGITGAGFVKDTGGKLLLQNKESALIWELPEQINKEYSSLPHIHVNKLGTEIMKNIMATPGVKNKRPMEKEEYWNWRFADG